jgi:large subunit ribosomal protein L2
MDATVLTVEYDPNRNCRICLVEYTDGDKKYIIAPAGLRVGQNVVSGNSGVAPEIGNAMPLSEIPLGTIISCIELRPGQGAVMARSAGAFAQLMAKEGKFVTIKLPSGETRLILSECRATIGAVSNSDHQLLVSGKAGRSRWLGRRPRTRPVVMNPVDHPMGGGEGKSSGGHPRSRNGIPAKGFRTRSKTKASNKYIIERRKK